MNDNESAVSDQPTPESIECKGSTEHAVRILIVTAMCLGFCIFCIYDLYFTTKYPYVPLGEDTNAFSSWAFNFVGMIILTPLSLIFSFFAIRALTRKVQADAAGIGYARKKKILWADVTQLDASKLSSKQILVLHAGDTQLVLDGYKLMEFKTIVDFVESHIPDQAETIT